MAGPLRKTMVYLGLADEDFDYEEKPAQQQQQHVAPVEDAPVSHPAPAQSGRAPVTPLRRPSSSGRSHSTQNAAPADMNEILTVHPRQYKDAQIIAESFRDGIPVIINLSQMTEAEARRLVDFASGLSLGLRGKIERVTKQVFLLSPAHVVVSGDESHAESEVDAAFFAQG